jgi:UDPglucose 6-dehydrogenase
MKKTIGIVGNGFVGGAVANGFKDFADVKIFDVYPERATHSYNDVIFSEYVFVCLPTPMTSVEGGECNTTIIEEFFDELPSICEGIFIIKSTVPIGTTQKLTEKYPHLNIIHNPEFLTAVNADEDFINADRHVIGGKSELVYDLANFYKLYFPNIPVYAMKSNESEAVKYFSNCFLATKVMVFNEMSDLCLSIGGMNYDTIIEAVGADVRIGNSHMQVPGSDGKYGFGGTCFPKDINSLIHIMKENGIDPLVLKAVWEQNLNYRTDKDWENFKSAVLKKEESYCNE